MKRSLKDRIMDNISVDVVTECWLWMGALSRGYACQKARDFLRDKGKERKIRNERHN